MVRRISIQKQRGRKYFGHVAGLLACVVVYDAGRIVYVVG